MASKKFIIEVEEGYTKCDSSCPLSCPHTYRACVRFGRNCELYDLTTMRIIEESNNQQKLITMSKSLRRSVTVDFDKMFEDLSYLDKVSFLADKMCDIRLADKLKVINNALAEVEIMDFIRMHRETAIKVLRGEGYEIH